MSADGVIEAAYDVMLDDRVVGTLWHTHVFAPGGPALVPDTPEFSAHDVDGRLIGRFEQIDDALGAVVSRTLVVQAR